MSDHLRDRDLQRRRAARESGFGLWKDLGIDGLEYQEKMRAEWDRATASRRARRITLPDAILQASAQVHGLTLVTRNKRDFPEGTPGVRIPYRLTR